MRSTAHSCSSLVRLMNRTSSIIRALRPMRDALSSASRRVVASAGMGPLGVSRSAPSGVASASLTIFSSPVISKWQRTKFASIGDAE